MKLFIDCREKKLISLCEKIDGLDISTGSLPLGDVSISNDSGELMVLFERKTINDLLSSISDGRYEEQSFRLTNCHLDNKQIFYIIEGNIDRYKGNNKGLYSKSTVHSCIFSLSYTKGFSVLCTNTTEETCEIIVKFFKKLSTNGGKPESSSYIDSLKLTKRSNLTDSMVTTMMLAQIPKVSKNAAEAILKEYNFSLKLLIEELSSDENCLDKLTIPIANNKVRKLSKPCILNVKKYLLNVGINENES